MSSRQLPSEKKNYWRVRIAISRELQDFIRHEAKLEDRHYSAVLSRLIETHYEQKRKG